jgi:hypothetical protein
VCCLIGIAALHSNTVCFECLKYICDGGDGVQASIRTGEEPDFALSLCLIHGISKRVPYAAKLTARASL